LAPLNFEITTRTVRVWLAAPRDLRVPISITWAALTGIGGLIVLFLTLAVIAWKSPDAWWFVVTALLGSILADMIMAIYERAYRNRREQWVFVIRFCLFAEAMVGGVLVGELAKAAIKITLFDISMPVGFVTFWSLNAFAPVFLFLDFLLKSHFRIVRNRQL